MGILVRNVTGHAFLRRHNNIIENGYSAQISDTINSTFIAHITEGNTEEALPNIAPWVEADLDQPGYETACRACRQVNSVETPFHLLSCDALWRERRDHLYTYLNIDAPYTTWKPQQVVDFYKHVNLEN